jgi:hypothetical protein
MWRADWDPAVLRGRVLGLREEASSGDAPFDFRALGPALRVVARDSVDHVRIGDGCRSIRFDLAGGGILERPVLIAWRLVGMKRLGPALGALHLLSRLERGLDPTWRCKADLRAPRWIIALRAFDALAAGASHQDLARGLFGTLVGPSPWRIEAPSIRLRVQRLAKLARRSAARSTRDWFD